MNFKCLTTAALLISSLGLAAQESPKWLRKSSISPDGKTVAFAYQGDIYTVPAEGGQARQITAGPAYDSDPLWAPDGRTIVFTSDREDSKDIWKIPSEGGTASRLTDYQGAETPLTVTPDGKVIFTANIQADTKSSLFPGDAQTYSVSIDGGRISSLVPFTLSNASVNTSGALLYEDYKGYEDPMRKHHTSSVTRDIWLRSGETFTKVSDFIGEDRNPVFAPDGDTFYYLSEREGSFNIFRSSISNPASVEAVSNFKTHPVRYLSIAGDGTLLCSWNGELYTFRNGESRKLEISIIKDKLDRDLIHRSILSGITSMSPAASGKEIAVVAHGDVYVCAVDFSSTRRITNTPSQERGVSFAPDGRTIYYAAERDGHWGIWSSTLTKKEDKLFSLSYDFKEELFTKEGETCFQPDVSPDGKWVAFLRNRTELVIRSTSSKEEKSLLKDINYSYSDGDLGFEWSPDSRYLLTDYMDRGGWNNSDIAIVDVPDGKIVNLTESGYSCGAFRWALDGKAMTWSSDRNGYRSHGSWGAETDIYATFFDAGAYSEFKRSENEDKIQKALKADDKKKEEKKDSSAKVSKLKLDLEHIEDRTVRLTPNSGLIGSHILSPDGTKLYYCVRLEKGMDLCCRELKSGNIKVVSKGMRGYFVADRSGKNVYLVEQGGVSRMDLASGKKTSISFSGDFDYKAAEERSYIFEHCWKQVQEKFYDPSLHGVDWQLMHDNYAAFLPYINNNEDFKELLSEMLGELNGSHTGARYYARYPRNTGRLGVIFDMNYSGKGLRIAEILPGSVLADEIPELKTGDLILSVNGRELGENAVWYEALDRLAGKRIELTVKASGKKKDAVVYAAYSDYDQLYRRWVRHNEELVQKLSGGKVGYVHVQGMNSDSFREVYSKALGKWRGCEALIVDTRHNGGGWLHDDLATFLSGKAYIDFCPRGQYISTEPYSKWNKPSCVLVCEDNYSDASGFPYVYKTLGIGKLIGTPVPGTMTAVWWETQIDNSLVFGIPQVTSMGRAEGRPLENLPVEPDILVYNDPASVIRGEDKQLEAAVREMLSEIE